MSVHYENLNYSVIQAGNFMFSSNLKQNQVCLVKRHEDIRIIRDFSEHSIYFWYQFNVTTTAEKPNLLDIDQELKQRAKTAPKGSELDMILTRMIEQCPTLLALKPFYEEAAEIALSMSVEAHAKSSSAKGGRL